MEDIDYAKASSMISYDGDEGKFYWLCDIGNGNYKGGEAGAKNKSGHFVIGLNYKVYQGSRIAFLLKTGSWPDGNVKYLDGDRGNLKWSNLLFRGKKKNEKD